VIGINRHGRIRLLKQFAAGMGERRLQTYAAAGAYYLFLSLVPIVMLVCSLLPYTPLTQTLALEVLRDYVPESMVELVERIIRDVYNRSSATLTISILLTIWSASSSLRALIRGVDAAYDARRRDNALVFLLRSFFYMIILLFVILISLTVMVYGGRIISLIQDALPYVPSLDFLFYLLRYLRFAIGMLLFALIFSILYKWMPDTRVKYKEQWPGAVFTAVVWVIFSSAFSFYVSLSGRYGAYGFIGTVMIAMVWMYFCLYFLLIGAFLNRFLAICREGPPSD